MNHVLGSFFDAIIWLIVLAVIARILYWAVTGKASKR